jgi:hypothetical protein
MLLPLDDQEIGLVVALGKGAADPEEEQLQGSLIGEAERSVL